MTKNWLLSFKFIIYIHYYLINFSFQTLLSMLPNTASWGLFWVPRHNKHDVLLFFDRFLFIDWEIFRALNNQSKLANPGYLGRCVRSLIAGHSDDDITCQVGQTRQTLSILFNHESKQFINLQWILSVFVSVKLKIHLLRVLQPIRGQLE